MKHEKRVQSFFNLELERPFHSSRWRVTFTDQSELIVTFSLCGDDIKTDSLYEVPVESVLLFWNATSVYFLSWQITKFGCCSYFLRHFRRGTIKYAITYSFFLFLNVTILLYYSSGRGMNTSKFSFLNLPTYWRLT